MQEGCRRSREAVGKHLRCNFEGRHDQALVPIICSQLLRSWWSFSYNVIIRSFPDPALAADTVQERKAMLESLDISMDSVAI